MPKAKQKKENKKEAPKKKKGGALKVIGMIFAVLVVMIVAAYFLFLKPASPEAMCKNYYKIMKSELAKQTGLEVTEENMAEMIGMTEAECVKDEKKRREGFRWENSGLIYKAQVTKCAANASSLDELENCETD